MLAFVFPGQGSQAVGMAKAACDRFQSARDVFAEADDALGFSLSKLCFEGPEADLQLTANSQPAILTASVALLRALASTGLAPDVVAGHSLGEYSALVCAGALRFSDAVRLVRKRGMFMQEAVPVGAGGMAAVGGSTETAEALCRDAAQGEVLSPANYNSPRQVVIAGSASAIERALALAPQRDIAAKALKVSAPFHCALMQPAADRLREELQAVAIEAASIPIVSNVDAELYQQADQVIDRLFRQVTAPVRWQQSVAKLVQMGVKHAIEIGPGKVLSNLIRQIDKNVGVANCEGPGDIEALSARAKNELKTYVRGSVQQEEKRTLKEWSEMNKEERDQAISELIDFDVVLNRLAAKPHDIYRWISVNKMPTWLVDGELRFHPVQFEEWLEEVGGIDTIKAKEAADAAARAQEEQAKEQAKAQK